MRVFVNARAVDVPVGATAADCVRASQPDEADAVAEGRRLITDSRGLPIPSTATAHAGSIFRTITNRGSEPES